MMYRRLLERTWQIFWGYKLLWIFGFVLALTTCSGIKGPPPTSDGNQGITYTIDEREIYSVTSIEELEEDLRELGREIDDGLLIEMREVLLTIAAAIVIVFLWILLASVFRYVMEAALIKMVDGYEATGKRVPLRRGLRLGFSRAAWRIFLIDLLVRFPVYVIFLVLFLLALVPLLLWLTGDEAAAFAGMGMTATMFFVLVLVSILVGALITLLTQLFRRVCVIEGKGVLSSIGLGFSMAVEYPKQTLITGLIVLAIQLLGYALFVPLLIILIPVELAFILLGVVAAAVPAAILGGLGAILFGGAIPWILAGVAAFPIFLLFIAAPFAFVSGLIEAYTSIFWTLSYRELKALPVGTKEKEPDREEAPKLFPA